ncbi:YeiH family protein [Serinibacter salmoneus]|uniref:Putative integral membrane protein (TIGR00698 family) n=1 Tax=Serinibacter salmoneus TaxID=556530 RepID=A0A2A9D3J6_9MICO|nr:putative sulfate exporter family transporter [Serinibacter salmoneus]PFG21234.1 putative integral membrane protein (TIGR00698 family) [Serinibacter salmoneus]
MATTTTRAGGAVVRLAPGMLLTALLAALALAIGSVLPLAGSAVPALLLGLGLALLRRPSARLVPGIAFSGKRVLQFAVVLLGAQLSLGDVAAAGLDSLPIMLTTLAACLGGAWLIGRRLGVTGNLRTLIGVGTGICGASAIAAVAPVIGAASAEIAYAMSTIFLFNVLAVLIFPLLGHALGMDPHAFGLFAGTAVNDTSSVVAAAAVFGGGALGYAVVVKLVRTLMIIPISVTLGVRTARMAQRAGEGGGARLGWRGALGLIPWFLVGFLVMASARSLGWIPDGAAHLATTLAVALVAMAMAGIGLSTDVAALRRAGVRPLLLGGALWAVVTLTSLGVLWATGQI